MTEAAELLTLAERRRCEPDAGEGDEGEKLVVCPEEDRGRRAQRGAQSFGEFRMIEAAVEPLKPCRGS